MRRHPVLLIFCALAVASCARPISLKVTTTPVSGVELTLNRPALESESQPSAADADSRTAEDAKEKKQRTAYSQCVLTDVPQGRDLTIIARKEGYEVSSVTIPSKAAPVGLSLLWSSRAWSSLIWSSTSPRAQYLILEDENHNEIDLQNVGVTIEMKPISDSAHHSPSPLPPFMESKMKGS